MKCFSTYRITLTALFAALVCVSTMLVQIPLPAAGGYANLGDGIILICAFLMHTPCAVIAAGLGSALADILAGYISFAPGTLIIKAGAALIASALFRRFGHKYGHKKEIATMIAAGILAEAFMVLGYFIYEAVFMGAGIGAAGSIPGNIGQGAAGIAVAILVAPALRRSEEVRKLMDRTKD